MPTLFTYSTKIDKRLVDRIIKVLYFNNYNFLKLAKKLRFKLEVKDNWNKLKIHLFYMEEEGLIEERHFPKGLVDYSIEQKGIDLYNKYYRHKS